MTGERIVVATARALVEAVADGVTLIVVEGAIDGLAPLTLSAGQSIVGGDRGGELRFTGDGIGLVAENDVERLHILCPPERRAIHLKGDLAERGDIRLSGITCTGQISLIFGGATTGGNLVLDDVTVAAADTTAWPDRPFGNGVEVLQGAITIWNRAAGSRSITVTANITSIGNREAPVKGSGLFIAGTKTGGTIVAETVATGDVHADSMLPEGTTGTVSGGVFVLADANVREVHCTGSVETHGANAVPIDNWGKVERWIVDGNAISHGPSAIGFINAGELSELQVAGSIETFGEGARGCGIYGPVDSIRARAVRTHGNAAIAIQIIDSLNSLTLEEGIFTEGEPGIGLVKGVMHETPAHAVHIEEGGFLGRLSAPRIGATGRDARTLLNEGRFGE